VKRADENLAEHDLAPLPPKMTPHSLRRTFATLLYALDESPPVVMAEMGHTDPALALKVYAQAMRPNGTQKKALAALVEGTAGPSFRPIKADEPESAQTEPTEQGSKTVTSA
jgi:integrase